MIIRLVHLMLINLYGKVKTSRIVTVICGIRDIHFLRTGVQRPGDNGKLEKFFNGIEYGRDRLLRVVGRLLYDIFAFNNSVSH